MNFVVGRVQTMARGDRTVLDFRPRRIPAQQIGGLFPYGDLWSFGIKKVGNVVTVYPGTIDMGQLGNWTTEKVDLTLSGDPDSYVYVRQALNHSSTQVPATTLSTRPAGNGSYHQWPLYWFKTANAGTTYSLYRVLFGGHDIYAGPATQ